MLTQLDQVAPSPRAVAVGTPVADAVERPPTPAGATFPLSPSVGSWLLSKPCRVNLAAALDEASRPASAAQEGDDTKVATYINDLTERVVSKQGGTPRDLPVAPTVAPTKPQSPAGPRSPMAAMDLAPRQRPSSAKFRTNAGATREQVVNFAQSLTSSIFRNSNTLAMQRASSVPQIRRPPTMPGSAEGSRRSAGPAAAPAQMTLRPAFRKQHSPIPAEEGAFFD